MGTQFLSSGLSRRDALKVGLKGSAYAAPIVLGAIAVTPAAAVSPTPTMIMSPSPTTVPPTPTVTTMSGMPSVTVTPSSGPAGTAFTITVANFPASTAGNVYIQTGGSDVVGGSNVVLPITTNSNGGGTVVFRDLGTAPGPYKVFASIGNATTQPPYPILQITSPGLIGSVTVASAVGCNPTVISGSGFPTGAPFDVFVQSPSGTNLDQFRGVQAQPNGSFQLFSRSLPAGSLKVVVQAGQNVLNTTPFMQMACAGGNQPYIQASNSSVVAGNPLSFTGFSFVPGSMLTVSARSTNGMLLGSTSVTASGTGDIAGTLSTVGFPVGNIFLVVTTTGTNTVLATNNASIV